jgi:hypothetical protein
MANLKISIDFSRCWIYMILSAQEYELNM